MSLLKNTKVVLPRRANILRRLLIAVWVLFSGSILEEPVASFIRASALSVFAHFTIDNDTVTEISPFKR